jgi:hypothetical protein
MWAHHVILDLEWLSSQNDKATSHSPMPQKSDLKGRLTSLCDEVGASCLSTRKGRYTLGLFSTRGHCACQQYMARSLNVRHASISHEQTADASALEVDASAVELELHMQL